MEMASTCIRVLLDLELIKNHHEHRSRSTFWAAAGAIKDMRFLKTFLMCARKWCQSNDLYLESDNVVEKVSLPSFLSCIEDTVHKYEEDIHSLSLISETEKFSHVRRIDEFTEKLIFEFRDQIKSFKQEIILAYNTLISCSSLHPNSFMGDSELVEFIDLILQHLVFILTNFLMYDSSALSAQVQALEVKLTFLKSFIPFAKLQGTVHIPALLVSHIEVVALSAARLSYMCSFCDDAEEKQNPEFCSMICEQQQKISAIDFRVYETYVEVLGATRSSKSLHSTMMEKQILNNFNDSLISCLWELLCYDSRFMNSLKNEMQILYAGLRFLRSILREHQEKIDEQNHRIGALLSEAGIVICSPSLNREKEEEVSFLESTEALDCQDMLANTNIHINLFKDQISGSSIIESLSSFHSLRVQEVSKPSTHMASKGKIPITTDVIVGLDDEAEKVIDRLISGPECVEIVPIVGMAGLGKTTLARKVYNENLVVYNFHIRLWCTVSQVFDLRNLLLQILCPDKKHSGTYEELKSLEEHDLQQKLYQKLKGNKYLVVFDDVWDIRVWNELRLSFPDDKNGSRILFTSRFSNMALEVQYAGEPHNVRPLNEKESFELLQKKVFGEEDCPRALCGFAMEIAKKCWGLPLAVVVIAGVLATIEHDILVWEEFAKSLTSTMVSGTDQCKKSLELSYGHLPHHLKACLLYFAAFREDEKIVSKNLMRLWVAEGFVEKIEGKRSEDIAEEYLMGLIGRNLVMVSASRSIGGVKTCYIHDLIFEFCRAEAKRKNFLQVLRGYDELSTFNEPFNLPRLSICSSEEDFIKSRLFCPNLGSLLFFTSEIRKDGSMLPNMSFFCIYKRLEVLNLEHIDIGLTKLPTEVESLVCLRYLALTSWEMTFIPASICNLSNLETFHLDSEEMVSFPETVWSMKKLRHVHIGNHIYGGIVIHLTSNGNFVDENSSTLPNLDTLSYLCLSFDQEGENILRKIPNVRRLKIKAVNKGNTSQISCNMSRLECLESLSLSVFGESYTATLNLVELSLPLNLKKLHLDHLCLPPSKMSLIEQLPNLEVLKLGMNSLDGNKWELMEGGFPELRVLTLSDLNIMEWTEADPESDDYFPCLQQLNLHSIFLSKIVPSCLERISTLETIKMVNCRDGVKTFVREIEEAQKNYGNENLKIISIGQ